MRFPPAAALVFGCLLLATWLAAPCRAAVLTVGPGGDFADPQTALDSATSNPGPDEIRLAAGTFAVNLRTEFADQQIAISGGWAPGFTRFDRNRRTLLDGGDVAPVVSLGIHDGAVVLSRLELVNGHAFQRGGGLDVLLDAGRLEVRDSLIRDNIAEATGDIALGGGGSVRMGRGSTFELRNTRVLRNTVKGYPAHGAGLRVEVTGAPVPRNRVIIASSSFVDNVASSEFADVTGVGLMLDLGPAHATLADTVFRGNRRFGVGQTRGVAFTAFTAGTGRVEVRRIRAVDQQAFEPRRAMQVWLAAIDQAQLVVGDSEVGRSLLGGVSGGVGGEGRLRLVNSTVADNRGGYGIQLIDEGTPGGPPQMSVANSIVFGNGMALQLGGAVAVVRNLVAVNPRFVDRAAADYRLRASSPARNAGSGNPPGGLGPLDVARRPRVRGAAVDIGANEVQ